MPDVDEHQEPLSPVEPTPLAMDAVPSGPSPDADTVKMTALPASSSPGFGSGAGSGRGGGIWQPPSLNASARLFPGYEVIKLLGRGGMGAVYQARQIQLDRIVAIKLLPMEISSDPSFADRFRREARAMARLHHPNVITVFDFGTTPEGHLYIVMEYVDGANLADVILRVGIDPTQALSILEQVCTALSFAHERGVIHRDIKPANVMIDTERHVKVADFGLARLTDPGANSSGYTLTGTVMGTLNYMAPEQMSSMDVDHRADIYSLGVMLYEMLCGEVPKGIFLPPSQRIGCDSRIDEIVVKAMQQAPARRYQTTAEMKSEVIAARTPTETLAVNGPTQFVEVRRAVAPALALLEPEPADERALVLRGVGKKSNVTLYAGIAVVVALAVGGGLYFTKSGQAAPAQLPSSAASTASAELEPGAIRLWNSPRDVPDGKWADGVIVLDNQALQKFQPASRDAILRASIRMNPDAVYPQLCLRSVNKPGGDYYRLQFSAKFGRANLEAVHGGRPTKLATWNLARSYGPDEWARIELKTIGDQITALCDGQVLGSVRDNSLPAAGGAGLFAQAQGYFRDIVYVPLDEPLAASPVPGGASASAGND